MGVSKPLQSAPAAARPGRAVGSKGERTRRRLINVTAALLERVRLNDLRVADISREAEVSTAAFYVYFADVGEAVLAAIQDVPPIAPAALALLETPWRRADAPRLARALVSSYLEFWDQHRTLFRVRNLAAEEGDVRFGLARQDAVQPMLDAIAAQIRRKEEASAPPGVSAQATAGVLMAMLERIGAVLPIYFDKVVPASPEDKTIDREAIIKATAHVFATMLA